MAPPVWLPFALQAGSMVSSGIGNYLEGRNQEKYYNRVTKMQQEAQRRRRGAERKAGMANIFFGLGGEGLSVKLAWPIFSLGLVDVLQCSLCTKKSLR